MDSFLGLVWSTLLLASVSVVHAATAEADMIDDAYASPGQLVLLSDGRALNLRCSGEGAPVIVLEAGGNSDSSTWYRVQPLAARLSRVCAYDRAGYGFSDEGPLPRDLDAAVADLHALIDAAKIPLPVLLVGHSLGSNIVRRFAQVHPGQVAGMLLLDPPGQGADERMPPAWKAQSQAALAQRDAFLDQCEEGAEAGGAGAVGRCLRAPPPWMGAHVADAVKRNKSRPSYWRTLRSELASNGDVFARQVPEDESYGSIPLVLLRATEEDDVVTGDVRQVLEASRSQTHARILAASTNSVAIDVPDASHDIQLDRPAALLAPLRRLLAAPTDPELSPIRH